MATAQELRQEFMQEMDKYGIEYLVASEDDNVVTLRFAAHEAKEGGGVETSILVNFDEQDNNAQAVHFAMQQFASCDTKNILAVLMKINEFNRDYRWCKVWIEQSGGRDWLTAESDAWITPGSAGNECIMMCVTVADIVEDIILALGDLVVPNSEAHELHSALTKVRDSIEEEAQ